jgi:hypothetical protein
VLIEMMAYLGDQAGVKYTIGTEDDRLGDTGYSESTIAKVKQKIDKELEAVGMDASDLAEQQVPDKALNEMDEEPDQPSEPTGLMARRA